MLLSDLVTQQHKRDDTDTPATPPSLLPPFYLYTYIQQMQCSLK